MVSPLLRVSFLAKPPVSVDSVQVFRVFAKETGVQS